MGNYRQLDVWQKSRVLASHTYRVTAQYPRSEWFGLVQQMRRAAVSIPSNIAEAHGRWTARDRTKFLLVSRGSLLELETQAFISCDLEFITETQTDDFITRIHEALRLLNGLLRYYRQKALK